MSQTEIIDDIKIKLDLIARSGNPPNDDLSLDEAKKQHILRIVAVSGGNLVKASKLLKIGRQTLYNALKKYKQLV
jgi:transcriptional regulator of acetoin/glycerol metabolism